MAVTQEERIRHRGTISSNRLHLRTSIALATRQCHPTGPPRPLSSTLATISILRPTTSSTILGRQPRADLPLRLAAQGLSSTRMEKGHTVCLRRVARSYRPQPRTAVRVTCLRPSARTCTSRMKVYSISRRSSARQHRASSIPMTCTKALRYSGTPSTPPRMKQKQMLSMPNDLLWQRPSHLPSPRRTSITLKKGARP